MLKNKFLATTSVLALFVVTGCQNADYHSRHDGVTTHAGNQLAVNEAKMVSDPWKSRANNTHLHGNGRRIATAVKKYELNGEEEKTDVGAGLQIPAGLTPPPASPGAN